MSGSHGCGHLTRDAAGCPECRAHLERMKSMLSGIPRAERLSPWDAADLRARLATTESALSRLQAAVRELAERHEHAYRTVAGTVEARMHEEFAEDLRSLLPGGDDAKGTQ